MCLGDAGPSVSVVAPLSAVTDWGFSFSMAARRRVITLAIVRDVQPHSTAKASGFSFP
jgi:hypothetical protein